MYGFHTYRNGDHAYWHPTDDMYFKYIAHLHSFLGEKPCFWQKNVNNFRNSTMLSCMAFILTGMVTTLIDILLMTFTLNILLIFTHFLVKNRVFDKKTLTFLKLQQCFHIWLSYLPCLQEWWPHSLTSYWWHLLRIYCSSSLIFWWKSVFDKKL